MSSESVTEALIYLDAPKLKRLQAAEGLSMGQLFGKLNRAARSGGRTIGAGDRAQISRNTLDKTFRGEGVAPDVAKFIADFFGMSVLELLAPYDPRYVPPVRVASGVPWEWEIESSLKRGGYQASIALYYFLFRMKHRHTAGRLGRGKFYLLSGLSSAERSRKREQLQRHAAVCQRVARHPQLAENESSTPILGEEGWWVVDRWIEGKSLAEYLKKDPWPAAEMPDLMKQILVGLSHLHAADVILRELAPERILIADAGRQPTLTDFELAKLLTGEPTVSPSEPWPGDDYRAPEVESGDVSVATDLYSWARILVHAASGVLPPKDEESAVLDKLPLLKPVWGIVRSCLQRAPEDRPQSVEVVEHAIRRWKS